MLTVFARNFGPALSGKSLQVLGTFVGTSWAEGSYDGNLSTGANGYSGSLWVKPDWAAGVGGAPTSFKTIATTSTIPGFEQTITIGYDSETSSDGLFILVTNEWDGQGNTSWFIAPVADDPFNASITGLNPSGTGYNSWNATASSAWVHLAWSFDADQTPNITNPPSISAMARMWWNGQELRMYDHSASGPISLQDFANPVKFYAGAYWYGRDYNLDKVGFRGGTADQPDADTWYNGGSPISPAPGLDIHFDFEDPNNWKTNGPVVYELTTTSSGGGGSDPIIDPTTFV